MRAFTIAPEVLEELSYAVQYREGEDQACLLVGELGELQTTVTGFLDLERFDSARSFVEAHTAGWQLNERRLEMVQAGIVGWCVLRKRGGTALRQTDELVHRTFFNRPGQLTLCADTTGGSARPWFFDHNRSVFTPGAESRLPIDHGAQGHP